jgi:hypothetical protein
MSRRRKSLKKAQVNAFENRNVGVDKIIFQELFKLGTL